MEGDALYRRERLTLAVARELENVESGPLDDEQATIVIVKDDGKVVWRTHCVGVEVGYPYTGVILLWLAVPRRDVRWGRGQWPRVV